MNAQAADREPLEVACTECGEPFICQPQGDCWCFHVEVRLPVPPASATCLCPACLLRQARESTP